MKLPYFLQLFYIFSLDFPQDVSPLKHKLDKNDDNDLEVKKTKSHWFSSGFASSVHKNEEASEFKYESVYEKATNNDKPVAADPPDNCEFVIGSMVELTYKSMKEPQPGVIKWIGTKNGKFYAGLEMVCS